MEVSVCSCAASHQVVSQVGGRLPVLPLFGLSHSHVDALQPLLGVLLILSLQHVRFAVCEDLKGTRQPPIPPLLGYHLRTKRRTRKINRED